MSLFANVCPNWPDVRSYLTLSYYKECWSHTKLDAAFKQNTWIITRVMDNNHINEQPGIWQIWAYDESSLLAFVISTEVLCNGPVNNITYNTWMGHEESIMRLSLAITVCHHSTSHVMPIGDSQDRFFLTRIMDSFSCSPSNTTFL